MKDTTLLHASWGESKTEGTFEESDGKHFCCLCGKMIRVGERSMEHSGHTFRGRMPKWTYWHTPCPPTKDLVKEIKKEETNV